MGEAEAIGEFADRSLCFLHLCEAEQNRHRFTVPLAEFDGCVAIGDLGAAPGVDAAASADGWRFRPHGGGPPFWPLDVSAMLAASPRWMPGSFSFVRVHSIAAREARAMGATIWGPKMLALKTAAAEPSGAVTSRRFALVWHGGRWHASGAGVARWDGQEVALPLLLGLAVSLRAHWTVWFGYGDGPRVRFITDPRGAREAFRLRDIPEGRARRAALRHWVEAHSRRNPHRPEDDAEALSWVRRHLSGAVDFTWKGLRCRIEPAQRDLEARAA